MDSKDVDILFSEQTRKLIDENRHLSADVFALKIAGTKGAAAIATQLKYLQKADEKIPTFSRNGCVIPPLSYQQATSEQVAVAREFKGKLAIDLTCGLGVDSYALSLNFEKVISIEMNETLAKIARHNFNLLSRDNIEVINCRAEEFLENYHGPKADLIFADPARRSYSDRKLVLLEDCSPNILGIEELIIKHSRRYAIKISPMFDIDEAFRCIKSANYVEIISHKKECKEVVVGYDESFDKPKIKITVIDNGLYRKQFDYSKEDVNLSHFTPENGMFLGIPDVAFYKSRTVGSLLKESYKDGEAFISSQNGYVFAKKIIHDIPVRFFKIDMIEEYKPKIIKRKLKELGIDRLIIMKKGSTLQNYNILKDLSIKEGGNLTGAVSRMNGKNIFILCSAVELIKTYIWIKSLPKNVLLFYSLFCRSSFLSG